MDLAIHDKESSLDLSKICLAKDVENNSFADFESYSLQLLGIGEKYMRRILLYSPSPLPDLNYVLSKEYIKIIRPIWISVSVSFRSCDSDSISNKECRQTIIQ